MMKNGRELAAKALVLCVAFVLASCGGGGGGGSGSVSPPAPTALSYPSPETYAVGRAISPLDPTVTGTVSNYSVSPSLPAGLSIDAATGVISGTPTSVAAGAPYTVTARNASGSTSFSISIRVGVAAGPPNVESIVLDGGPPALTVPTGDTAFVSVQVCVPNTTTCQTIDHVEVDTGSVGLRIIAGGTLGPGDGELTTLALPAVRDAGGNPLAECLMFADGFSWGSVVTADVTLPVSGEQASGINIQVIGATSAGDPSAASPSCVPSPPLVTENTVNSFGANGILGVGLFQNDCATTSTCPPGGSATYYSCPNGVCSQITASSVAQVLPNPVSRFAQDNNGVILELPAVAASGAANPGGGLLVFGIGTRSNNGLGSATQLPADRSTGYITAMLNGSTLTHSFLDSGSNGTFFPSSLAVCPAPNETFYCPAATTAENASLGSSGLAADFEVGNAASLFANTSVTALDNVAGPNPDPHSLDLGLPFFFGKHIYTGFENPSTGAAPYFAY